MLNLRITNNQGPSLQPGLVLLSLTIFICFAAGVASAGSVGPTFLPPQDFDGSGKSDVLLHRISGGHVGINQTQIIEGTSLIARGWPDLNVGNDGTVQYETIGFGRFDPSLGTQAQIVTRPRSSGSSRSRNQPGTASASTGEMNSMPRAGESKSV